MWEKFNIEPDIAWRQSSDSIGLYLSRDNKEGVWLAPRRIHYIFSRNKQVLNSVTELVTLF